MMSVMTEDQTHPRELVQAIKTGGKHRRWQAAFALTKYLQPSVEGEDPASLRRESDGSYQKKLEAVRGVLPELLEVFGDPSMEDAEVRRFLALGFGYLGDVRVLPALVQVLERNDQDLELVHYALAAIATTADIASREKRALPELDSGVVGGRDQGFPASGGRSAGHRGLCVGGARHAPSDASLGRNIEARAAGRPLECGFWFGAPRQRAGEGVIAEILDRGPLYQAAGPDRTRQDDLFLNAVRSAGMLRSPALRDRLVRIAKSDDNLRARNLAIRLLEESS